MISKRTACAVAVTMALGVLSACSDTKSSGPGDSVAPTDSAAPATDPATTVAPTTIETTIAPTTTVAAGPYLRSDGLGAFDFGASDLDVLAGTSLTVTSDVSREYTTDLGDGTLLSTDGGYSFLYSASRSVCWDDGAANRLCAYFGGANPTNVVMVGWDYFTVSGSTPLLGTKFSASGATINALLSSIAGLPPISGECYGYSNSEVDGIALDVLVAAGGTFGTYADDGTYTLTVPAPPANVTYMQTGAIPQPYSIDGEGGDC